MQAGKSCFSLPLHALRLWFQNVDILFDRAFGLADKIMNVDLIP